MQRREFDELSKRRRDIRSRIRRDEIEEYFERRRKEVLQSRVQHPPSLFPPAQTAQQFLGRVERELRERPVEQWGRVLEEIRAWVPHFKGDLDVWKQFKVGELLLSVIKSELAGLGVQQDIVKTLTALLNSSASPDCTFVGYLVEYHAIEQVILFMHNVRLPLAVQTDYLHFLAALSRASASLRRDILNKGAAILLQNYGNQLLEGEFGFAEEERFKFLGLCGDFLGMFAEKEQQGNIGDKRMKQQMNFQFLSGILPLILRCLQREGSERIIQEALLCVHRIVKFNNKKMLQAFEDRSLIKSLFEFVSVPRYCNFALNIISRLASYGSQRTAYCFFQQGIFDLLASLDTESNRTYINVIINIINNLVLKDDEVSILIAHPVWQIVLSSLTHCDQKIKEEAFHCLLSIANAVDSPNLKMTILHSGKIINAIICQIAQFRTCNATLTKDALKILNIHIRLQIQFRNVKFLLALDTIYQLSFILDEIQEHGSNDNVVEEAMTINEIFTEGLVDLDNH